MSSAEKGYIPLQIPEIEKPTISSLCHKNEISRKMAAYNLPQALSLEDVSEVGQKVHIYLNSGDAVYSSRRRAERRAIVALGQNAMDHQDLVTANNAVSHLKNESLLWRPSALSLWRSVRNAKKQIVGTILDSESSAK